MLTVCESCGLERPVEFLGRAVESCMLPEFGDGTKCVFGSHLVIAPKATPALHWTAELRTVGRSAITLFSMADFLERLGSRQHRLMCRHELGRLCSAVVIGPAHTTLSHHRHFVTIPIDGPIGSVLASLGQMGVGEEWGIAVVRAQDRKRRYLLSFPDELESAAALVPMLVTE